MSCCGTTCRRRQADAGFTLVEVMIALGILVIGLSMLATAFPTAMIEGKESIDASLATMIQMNGLTVCRLRLGHSQVNNQHLTLGDCSGLLDLADRAWPVPQASDEFDGANPKTRYGYLAAIRQLGPNQNNYQLALVAFRKFKLTDSPGAEIKFSDGTISGNTVAGNDVAAGAPVIHKASGEYAFIISTSGTTGRLSRALPNGPALLVGNPSHGESPALGCLVTLTPLNPDR